MDWLEDWFDVLVVVFCFVLGVLAGRADRKREGK
jgi:hypothetical protein